MFSPLVVLISVVVSSVLCHNEYGCDFISNKYDLYPEEYNSNPNHLTWGTPLSGIYFDNFNIVERFIEKVNRKIQTVLRNHSLNELTETIHMNNMFVRVQAHMTFEEFMSTYTPPMSPLRTDNLGLIMHVFRLLSEDIGNAFIPDAEGSLFIAAKDLSVNPDYYREAYGSEGVNDEFISKDVVGIIKLSYRGSTDGYIVIDMKNAIVPVSVVWSQYDSNQFNTKSFGRLDVTYELVGPDSSYILVTQYQTRPDGESLVNTDVIYVKYPLCSFLYTESRMLLSYDRPMPAIMKLNEQGENVAHVAFKLIGHDADYYREKIIIGYNANLLPGIPGTEEGALVELNSLDTENEYARETLAYTCALLGGNLDEGRKIRQQLHAFEEAVYNLQQHVHVTPSQSSLWQRFRGFYS